MDFLKSHGRKHTEVRADLEDVAGFEDAPDPAVVRAALARFLALPLTQRSAVILKDVLDHSLEETAATMGTTVLAVKAALVRGRKQLLEAEPEPSPVDAVARQQLDRYAARFNARDWDGVRALVSEDCRLDLVSKSQRRGKSVGGYFARYEQLAVTLRVAELEGELVLAAYEGASATPAYFILLTWEGDRVQAIRDFRYVPYIAAEAAADARA
jgi:RNA polymerase sigma-70 factor (ECF subfamily)